MKRKTAYLLLGFAAIISSCKKEEEVLNPIPYIEIVEVTPVNLTQFSSQISITLSYDDQDGDLGFEDPDSMSVYVTDSRLTNPDLYHIPPLSPVGQTLHVRGNLLLKLQAPFLLGAGSSETIHYTIKVRDRAGNLSNIVQTPDITITQ